MILAKLSHQQVIGSLRATGSTDTDVLFAKKEELLQETKRLKLLGVVPIIIGAILCLSIVGAIIGIPMILLGYSVRKAYQHNLKVADEALAQYINATNTEPAV